MISAPDWEAYRQEWPHVREGVIWLQHAGITPLCRRVITAGAGAMERFAARPDLSYRALWTAATDGARAKVADLLGTTPERIALVKNTSQGLIFIAEGLVYEPGDNIVTLAAEYPANRLPWRAATRLGAEVRVVEPDSDGRFPIDSVAAAMDQQTRVVAVSWVQYLNGFRIDLAGLKELCVRHDAWLVVDAVQGLGALPFDPALCDAAACGGHKWICGAEGAGFLYVSERLLEVLQPFNVSWHSVATDLSVPGAEIATEDGVPALKAGAERLEEGTPNLYGNLMLGEAATMLKELNPAWIELRHRELQDHLLAQLTPRGYEVASSLRAGERSGIIAIRHPDHDPDDLLKRLKSAKIYGLRRADNVRLSPHFYNNLDDMDEVAAALP